MIQAIKESLSKIPKHNTIIGGIGVVQNTEALLASKIGISANQIFNFEVREDMSVACFIRDSYVLKSSAFSGDNNITYYNDIQGKCWKLSDNSLRSGTLEWINFPNVTDVGTQTFYAAHKLEEIYLPNCERALGSYVCFRVMNNVKRIILPKLQIHQFNNENDFMYNVKACEHLYIPLCTTIGKTLWRENQSFNNSSLGMNIYAHPSMETIYNGGLEGDLAFAESARQANIEYVTSFAKPLPVEDIVVGNIYPHSVQLNFTDPNGANQGGFYEIYVNGVYNNEASKNGYATGLIPETTYQISIKAVDRFYNKSILSEKITVTTIAPLPFEFVMDTTKTLTGSSLSNQVKLPLVSNGSYNFVVNWGDGSSDTITVYNQPEITHTYATAGIYTISITGQIEGFKFNNGAERLKILSIESWGLLKIFSSESVFYNCSNLNCENIKDTLDLSRTALLTNMFRNCTSLTSVNNINNWAFRQVTGCLYMFSGCAKFDQALSFNTSKVRDFSFMFHSCPMLNSPIDFDTNQGSSFTSMFERTTNFNQPLNLDTGKGINFTNMFYLATSFDQPIDFDCSRATNLSGFMRNTYSFNSPVVLRNTRKVTDWRYFAESARVFNQPVEFDFSSATNFTNMFYNAYRFNQPVVGATPNLTNITSMFFNATDFNSEFNIDTGKVTGMTNVFRGAHAFEQPLGHLDISSVGSFTSTFLAKSGYSPENVDNLLNGWAAQTVKPNLTLSLNSFNYTSAGAAAKSILTSAPNNWTITDGGQI